ncbi:MAG: NYN domain-containing protein, partial [Planctomycetes bacterium]|nr:NYN domain-containing protein [Planctomycetota bacterium]
PSVPSVPSYTRRFAGCYAVSSLAMLSRFVHGRVAVFIDVSNVLYAQRTFGWRLSYARFMQYLKTECPALGPVVAFTVTQGQQSQRFLDMLQLNGYELRTKPLKAIWIAKGQLQHKGNLDVEIALEMVERVHEYETAVLVSGDSDFAPVLDRLKAKGKRVIVVSTRGHVARELLERAKFLDLRKLKCWVSQPNPTP